MSNNISGDPSNWITNKQITELEEEDFDPVQRAQDIKYLKAEINFKVKQIKEKLKILYSMESLKETYDNIISFDLFKFYEN